MKLRARVARPFRVLRDVYSVDPAAVRQWHAEWRRYALEIAEANLTVLIALIIGAILLFWPSDFWVLDDPVMMRAFAIYRGTSTAVALLVYAIIAFMPAAGRYPALMVYVAGLAVGTAAVTPVVDVAGLEHRYIDVIYAVPLGTMVLVEAKLTRRILLTFGVAAAWLVVYSQAQNPDVAATAIGAHVVTMLVMCLISCAGGHAVRTILLRAFIAEMRLTELNAALEDRVKDATAELDAIAREQASRVEQERARLAYELHDETGQLIQGLRFEIDLMRMKSAEPEGVGRLAGLTDRLVGSIRAILQDLRPAILDDLGLPAALESLCHRTSEPGLDVVEDIDTTGRELDAAIALAVYRVAQEALTNVTKHARASTVRVSLRRQDDEVVLRVEDDGVGIPPDPSGGIGLLGMRERARGIGASLSVGPGEHHGTRVTLRAPWRLRESLLGVRASTLELLGSTS